VAAAVLAVITLWGVLFLSFEGWRAGIQARIDYGMANVAPVVEPLEEIDPHGIAQEDWRDAVSRSEEMLGEVVGTGRLDQKALERLRSDLSRRVAEARNSPQDAPAILGRIWDDMAKLKKFRTETQRPVVLPELDQPADVGAPDR
jgi:hypothetical protein